MQESNQVGNERHQDHHRHTTEKRLHTGTTQESQDGERLFLID